jgi:hypothetical protein
MQGGERPVFERPEVAVEILRRGATDDGPVAEDRAPSTGVGLEEVVHLPLGRVDRVDVPRGDLRVDRQEGLAAVGQGRGDRALEEP